VSNPAGVDNPRYRLGSNWLVRARAEPQVADFFELPADTVERLVGTIDPGRSLAAQRAYLAAFFDLHLRHRDSQLLDGPTRRYPDVQLIQ
jgi:hypothetical protein